MSQYRPDYRKSSTL